MGVASSVSEILPLFTGLQKWPNFPFGSKKIFCPNWKSSNISKTGEVHRPKLVYMHCTSTSTFIYFKPKLFIALFILLSISLFFIPSPSLSFTLSSFFFHFLTLLLFLPTPFSSFLPLTLYYFQSISSR